MALGIGDQIPDVTLYLATAEGPKGVSSKELMGSGKKVVFAVPGPFTPICAEQHVPNFLNNLDALKAKGVDEVICLSVNDAFVMGAWGKDTGATGKINMVSDGNAEFTKAIGQDFDLSALGLSVRSHRYAMLLENGVVKVLNVDEGAELEVSGAEAILAKL